MFKEWINKISEAGLLCDDYSSKVKSALSKKQLADIGLDANGIRFLIEMQQKGFMFPYEDLQEEFSRFINGNYIFESEPNEKGVNYTCELYCGFRSQDHIEVRTTALALLDCVTRLILKNNYAASIYLDTNSYAEVIVPPSATCRIYLYGDATVKVVGDESKVKIINMN